MSESFPYADHLNEVTLSHNRLTSKGINSIISSLRINKVLLKKIHTLDLSYNKLSANAVDCLCDLFDDQHSVLHVINLEANCIGDIKIIKICESIAKSLIDKVTYLNIGHNLVSDKACANIASLVHDCPNLEVLIVYWNHIKNFGASLIMTEVKNHVSLKIFDISWNSIGENLTHEPSIYEIKKIEKVKDTDTRSFMNVTLTQMRKTMFISLDDNCNPKTPAKYVSPFAKELGRLFQNFNSKIIHLDISHNNIDYNDCKFLSKNFN